MNRENIIKLRLFNQGLSTTRFESAVDVVAHFGAIQAQDYGMSLWAVGLRIKNNHREAIQQLIDTGQIIRTHILRPTWHMVHPKDIRWMMELSAPNVKKATQYVDKKEGLTEALFVKAFNVIEKQFREKENLSKEEIMSCMAKHRMPVSHLLTTQLILRAELEMLLCNGESKGTYALFEKRIPPGGKISKLEAIVKLTQLYFQSRGPATIHDFSWWSGLSINDVKTGMAELEKNLLPFTHNELKYFYFDAPYIPSKKNPFTLLPCFDEYTVGYSKSRSLVLPDINDSQITGNGIFKPIMLSKNEIVGTWKKNTKSPYVEIQKFSDNIKIPAKSIKKGIEAFNFFIT